MDNSQTTETYKPVEKLVKLSKKIVHPLIKIGSNHYKTACGTVYYRDSNGCLINANKSQTPNKRIRAKLRRKMKNENKNTISN